MEPDYKNGDFVLIAKFPFLNLLIKPGRRAVFRFRGDVYIKEIVSAGPGTVRLRGISPNSISTEAMGDVSTGEIMGIVIAHFG